MTERRASGRRMGLAVGGSATALAALVFVVGGLDRLNDFNLDLHFRHFNTLQADPRIVLIDIDDTTLRVMPDWPWPRRVFADLVSTLNEFQPRSIVLDFVFDLPSKPRVEYAGLDKNYDMEAVVTSGADASPDETIFDDRELEESLRDAGNVFIAMSANISGPSAVRTTQCEDPRVSAREFLRQNPEATWEAFFRAAMPGHPLDIVSPERESLLSGFRQALAQRFIGSRLANVTSTTQRVFPTTRSLIMPLEVFAQTARGVGLVSFRRTRSPELLRSLPLVVDAENVLLPQLGVTVALDDLGVPPDQLELDRNRWMFGRGGYRRAAHIGEDGGSLVNWHAPRGEDWRASFSHLPAAFALELHQNRRAITDNGQRLGTARAELVRVRHAATPAIYADYVKLVNQQIELTHPEPRASARAPNELDAAIRQIEDESVVWLQRAWSLWRDETPQNPEESGERERIKRLHDRFGEGQYPALIDTANQKLEARNDELIRELGPLLHEKICLVGYTATAMADMIPTPVDPAMPGVMVHANVINMFLQNRFASAASPAVNALVLLAAGLVTTLMSSRVSPRWSVTGVLALSAAVFFAAALIFRQWTYHLAALPMVVAMLFVWATVTVYRQATEERARRHLQRALAQYTSPAVAARIVETARSEGLAPRVARVSCFFSDLSGFTALSERLGPERTRDALNPYLREVSAVLSEQGAMVNKFIGDGIFAFFNVPLLACPDHAARACHSALSALEAVRRIGGQSELTMRIGLSTGEAFVGDYGSDMKLDYTCIGDTVNVGSRLERLNKVLGTSILVDDPTRREAGEAFAFRSLGRIVVPGKTTAVLAHELVALAERVDDGTRTWIARFEEAVRCFQTCQWDACLSRLAECGRNRPADAACDWLRAAVERARAAPGPHDSDGAVHVTGF